MIKDVLFKSALVMVVYMQVGYSLCFLTRCNDRMHTFLDKCIQYVWPSFKSLGAYYVFWAIYFWIVLMLLIWSR